MKRKQTTFMILTLIFLGLSTYAQVDEKGNILQTNNKEQLDHKSTKSIDDIPNVDFQFDSVRTLFEINKTDNSEAYPWISDDGLRLYYTLQTESVSKIVMSERKHPDSTFSAPQILSINSSKNDNLAPWLTTDELDLYFIIKESYNNLSTTIYHASRKSKTENFGEPIKINLSGNISDFISSPSLTNDFEELYVYNNNVIIENILIFKKDSNNNYTLSDTLNIPDGYEPCTGKLGKDGLKFYISLNEVENSRELLYVYNRESVEDTFDSLSYLNNELINDSSSRNIQPYISNNGNYFVYVHSNGNKWENNDLYIAYNKTSQTELPNTLYNENLISVYPNPTTDYLTFEFHDSNNKECTISIFTIDGVHVETKVISNNSSKIEIKTSKFKPGVYLYKITSRDSYIGNGKFIVKEY